MIRPTLILCLLFAIGCKKKGSELNLPVASTSNCEEIDFSECIGFEEFVEITPKYEKPCFNPHNSDEFIYRQGNQLWIHDLTTAESKVFKDDVRVMTQPDWSTKGWITFSQIDRNVWILSDDGGELKQLTTNESSLYPEFNANGEEILFLSTQMQLIDLQGTLIDQICKAYKDSLCSGWKLSSWSTSNILAGEYQPNQSDYGLCIYDQSGNVIDILYRSDGTNDGADFLRDIEWHPDNERIFFTDGYGIKVVDVNTKNVTRIVEGCNSHSYGDISISSDGETIVATRFTSSYANCVITSKTGIVRMDIDGSNEEELLMP